MGFRADDGTMVTFIIILAVLAAMIAMGLLAVRYGSDSRPNDPRDLRHSWH
jgi:hypothetical protein